MADHPESSGKRSTSRTPFAELSDAMADLEANMMHFQLMHESLARFSESFASFLYGLNMNAFCVDYPEQNLSDAQSSKKSRAQIQVRLAFNAQNLQVTDSELTSIVCTAPTRTDTGPENDGEMTFMTTDVSFVDNPPASAKPTPRLKTPEVREEGAVEPPSRKEAGLVVWPVPEAVVSDEYSPWRFRHGIRCKSGYCFPTAPDSTGVGAEGVECWEVGSG
ncbi:DASH complex subunit Dam1 [Colletotrichum camelliae]|nr:DASH complex subunit Dam1 [Colletotrichum camelliae]